VTFAAGAKACPRPPSPSLIVSPSQGPKRGTKIAFRRSRDIITRSEFDFATIERRPRELAFVIFAVIIVFTDKRDSEKAESAIHNRQRA
jgi:DNA gyrase subunit B